LAGGTILGLRKRVLRFVRERYETMYRTDGMPEETIAIRLPKMWVVVAIGIGCLVVAVIAATAVSAAAFDCATRLAR
jgi:hypothetical protein